MPFSQVTANHTIPKAIHKLNLLFFIFCVLLNEFDFQPLFADLPAKTQSVYLLFQYCREPMVPLRWHSQTFKINFEIRYVYLRLYLLCFKITTFSFLLFFPAKLSYIYCLSLFQLNRQFSLIVGTYISLISIL